MPNMTNAKSAPVLDSADAELDRLNWILFKQEQDARLWAPKTNDQDWYPGEGLWYLPTAYSDDDQASNMYNIGFTGNAVRPMFEEVDVNSFHALGMRVNFVDDRQYINHGRDMDEGSEIVLRCTDCEVYWNGEDPCFVCGQDVPIPMAPKTNYKITRRSDLEAVFENCRCRLCTQSRDATTLVGVDLDGDTSVQGYFSAWLQREMRRELRVFEDRAFARLINGTPRREGRSLFTSAMVDQLLSYSIVDANETRRIFGVQLAADVDEPQSRYLDVTRRVQVDGISYIPSMGSRVRTFGRSDAGLRFFQLNRQPRAVWDDRITIWGGLQRYLAVVGTPIAFEAGDHHKDRTNPESTPSWSRRRPRYER